MSHSDKRVGRERSVRVPRTRSSPLPKSAQKKKNRKTCSLKWRARRVIPLTGEMSHSDKRVGRERSVRVPRTRSSPLQKSAQKKENRKTCSLKWRARRDIPLTGEMSRSDKGVGRERSVRVPRTRSSPLPKSAQKKRTGKPVLLNGAPGGTRTPDLLVRSQSLYPAELRAHI